MAVYYQSKRRASPVSMAVMMTMIAAAVILLNADCGGAAVVVKSNATYGCIGRRKEECLIGEDLELEWLIEYSSHVARVLKTIDPRSITGGANNAGQTPCGTGKGKGYNCDTPGKPKPSGPCTPPNKYKRGCSS